MNDVAGAFDDGADSDEVHAKKGGKKQKDKKEHQGKKKKKHDSEDDGEEIKEATATEQ